MNRVLDSTIDYEPDKYRNQSFCFDDLIQRKMMQLQIDANSQTRLSYTILIVSSALLSICAIVLQITIPKIMSLPEIKFKKFLQQFKEFQIKNRRLFVDYKHCLGSGTWADVYLGCLN